MASKPEHISASGPVVEAIARGVDRAFDQQAALDGARLTTFDPRRLGATAVLPCGIWKADSRADAATPLADDEVVERGTQKSLDEFEGLHTLALAVSTPVRG